MNAAVQLGEVVFVGAGPGDPRLITVAGRDAVAAADVVLTAGSLVNPEILAWAKPGAEIHDTAGMNLDETTAVCLEAARAIQSDELSNPTRSNRVHAAA